MKKLFIFLTICGFITAISLSASAQSPEKKGAKKEAAAKTDTKSDVKKCDHKEGGAGCCAGKSGAQGAKGCDHAKKCDKASPACKGHEAEKKEETPVPKK